MIKKISALLAFAALFAAHLAFAQGSAVVTAVSGSAQVQTGSATPRTLRQGDEVAQGDTVSTAAASSLVLKFDDGHVAALTQNSRMTITAYQYEAGGRTGNMLLSLITGGMRAVRGLLGRSQPERVAYRAATATIGIRGTDATIVTDGRDVAVTVSEGAVTFTHAGETIVIPAGRGAFLHDGRITPDAAAAIFNRLPPGLQLLIGNLNNMTDLINQAGPGVPRPLPGPPGPPAGTPGPNVPPGGGTASQR
jgi:hypothetical protein